MPLSFLAPTLRTPNAATRTVTITGLDLTLTQADVPAADGFHLRVCADTVRIAGPVINPGRDLRIAARCVVFRKGAWLDASGPAPAISFKPGDPAPQPNQNPGATGASGADASSGSAAGSIELVAETIQPADAAPSDLAPGTASLGGPAGAAWSKCLSASLLDRGWPLPRVNYPLVVELASGPFPATANWSAALISAGRSADATPPGRDALSAISSLVSVDPSSPRISISSTASGLVVSARGDVSAGPAGSVPVTLSATDVQLVITATGNPDWGGWLDGKPAIELRSFTPKFSFPASLPPPLAANIPAITPGLLESIPSLRAQLELALVGFAAEAVKQCAQAEADVGKNVLILRATGGPGGRGQDGAPGLKGATGAVGDTGMRMSSGFGGSAGDFYNCQGHPGGPGGKAGNPGRSGNGGPGGALRVLCLSSGNFLLAAACDGGVGGAAAKPGTPGPGGDGGSGQAISSVRAAPNGDRGPTGPAADFSGTPGTAGPAGSLTSRGFRIPNTSDIPATSYAELVASFLLEPLLATYAAATSVPIEQQQPADRQRSRPLLSWLRAITQPFAAPSFAPADWPAEDCKRARQLNADAIAALAAMGK